MTTPKQSSAGTTVVLAVELSRSDGLDEGTGKADAEFSRSIAFSPKGVASVQRNAAA